MSVHTFTACGQSLAVTGPVPPQLPAGTPTGTVTFAPKPDASVPVWTMTPPEVSSVQAAPFQPSPKESNSCMV
jgi:hypothetical protein